MSIPTMPFISSHTQLVQLPTLVLPGEQALLIHAAQAFQMLPTTSVVEQRYSELAARSENGMISFPDALRTLHGIFSGNGQICPTNFPAINALFTAHDAHAYNGRTHFSLARWTLARLGALSTFSDQDHNSFDAYHLIAIGVGNFSEYGVKAMDHNSAAVEVPYERWDQVFSDRLPSLHHLSPMRISAPNSLHTTVTGVPLHHPDPIESYVLSASDDGLRMTLLAHPHLASPFAGDRVARPVLQQRAMSLLAGLMKFMETQHAASAE